MTADELVEGYHAALKEQAEAVAALSALDDRSGVMLAEAFIAAGDVSVEKAKNVAKASAEYRAALDAMVPVRRRAEDAKAEVEYLRTRWETWRTKMSMQKVKMQTNG